MTAFGNSGIKYYLVSRYPNRDYLLITSVSEASISLFHAGVMVKMWVGHNCLSHSIFKVIGENLYAWRSR